MEGGKATLMTGAGLEAFLVDAMEAVNIHFIGSVSDLDNEEKEGFQPEFVHQHFGEKEQIFGYTDLHVDIHYTSASMFIYPTISFDKRIDKVHKDLAPDDIIIQLKEQLPKGEMDMMFSSRDQFVKEIEKQESFRPAGTLVNKYSVVNADGVKEQFEVYKVSESSPEFDSYLARVQTVALWYIDACEYTDNSDERWMHYFVYEKTKSSTGGDCVALAGYMSVYNFYAYPQHQRPRIAQVLVLPPYRRSGHGAKLLQTVYDDLVPQKNVVDITAEDPADNFVHLRDFVDCVNCSKLESFSPENLKQGFSDKMKIEAREKLKLGARQSRRVYEILRLKYTHTANTQEMKAYRLDVKRRLNIPFKKDQRDWLKLTKALDQQELATVAASNMNVEKRMQDLHTLFEEAVADYRLTINRLDTFGHLGAPKQNGSNGH